MTASVSTGTDTPGRLFLITGPSGAGRSTAIKALEDLGFETIDNIPLSLLPRLFDGNAPTRPIALGVDVRNRDFSVEAFLGLVADLMARPGLAPKVVYLDCRTDVLIRRYSETRRRHPLSPDGSPGTGIEREADLMIRLRETSDILIDSSDLSPHDLKAEIARICGNEGGAGLTVSVESFSYKRGIPQGADMVLDCRFLQNPHWEPALRPMDGRDDAVAGYVAQDARYGPFVTQVREMLALLLPASQSEGKTHFTLCFGCTGGRHRSVALAETISKGLAEDGWRVSKRHRELERQNGTAPLNRGNSP